VATTGVLKALENKYDISSKNINTTQYKESLLRATKSCNILMRARGWYSGVVSPSRRNIMVSYHPGQYNSWMNWTGYTLRLKESFLLT